MYEISASTHRRGAAALTLAIFLVAAAVVMTSAPAGGVEVTVFPVVDPLGVAPRAMYPALDPNGTQIAFGATVDPAGVAIT